jgi:hypothetical protein
MWTPGESSLMSDSLEDEIAALPNLTRIQLQRKWRSRLKKEPPSHLEKPLLVPMLAYKLQEQAYGGLKPAIRRRIRELVRSFDRDPKRAGRALSQTVQIKAGTRLLRNWNGETHQVTVSESGFEYGGQRYKSLSEIARLITGTRWSGPLFFGIRKSQR